MRAGQMRHEATFQRPVRTTDEVGQEVVTYEDEFEDMVEVKAMSGKMLQRAQQIDVSASHVINMRYQEDYRLTEQHRIKIGCNTYDIKFIDNVKERDIWLQVYAEQHKGAYGDQSGY
jgi:SPP1 family predicted phage head-tail adaptor